MHRKDIPLRRLAFALAVPVIAVGAIALSAGIAASSSSAATVAATDEPTGGGGGGGGGQTNAPQSNFKLPTGLKTLVTSGAVTKTTKKTVTPTKSLTKSPTKSPTTSPTTSPTKSPSASASRSASKLPSVRPSGSGGGVVPVPGGGASGGAAAANCAGVQPSPPSTVAIGTAGGKQALVDQSGCALYLDTNDTAQASACDAACLQTWRPLPGPGQAGSGVDQSKLATFTRDDGTVQVTYGGHQLYRFTGDKAPGDANGQGQQNFFLVDATGNPITS
jgi:predicted lipoprotein with Yx(FWY)xxD motif